MAKKSFDIQITVVAVSLIVSSIAVSAVVFDFGGTVRFNLGPDGVKLELEGTPSSKD